MAKALVVDDSRAVRMILGRMLKELGFAVHEAGNGKEALALMKTEREGMSLVLAGGTITAAETPGGGLTVGIELAAPAESGG